MVDTLRKVKPGDRLVIPARTYNAFVDAARKFQSSSVGQGQGSHPAGRQTGIILVRNDSEWDRNRFDVMGVDVPIFDPVYDEDAFKNQVALSCVTPTVADHAGRFVILMEPIASGELGRACISGACPVMMDIGDEGHAFADVSDGDATVLKSGETGAAFILWRESGADTAWAVVRLANPSGAGVSQIAVKLTVSNGGGSYTGREQVWNDSAWQDKAGATDIACINLSETTGGCTSSLDVSPAPVVLATIISGAYFFERETNAKYKA